MLSYCLVCRTEGFVSLSVCYLLYLVSWKTLIVKRSLWINIFVVQFCLNGVSFTLCLDHCYYRSQLHDHMQHNCGYVQVWKFLHKCPFRHSPIPKASLETASVSRCDTKLSEIERILTYGYLMPFFIWFVFPCSSTLIIFNKPC